MLWIYIAHTCVCVYIAFDENQQTNYRGLDRNLPQMLYYISRLNTVNPPYFGKKAKYLAL